MAHDLSRRRFLGRAAAGVAGLATAGLAGGAEARASDSRRTLASTQASGGAVTRKPNILFILADDLGYGDLGCYGQERIRTPHIDRLAAEGLRFTDAYAGSTVCAPSRCCLVTGFHTGHCLVRSNARIPLRPEDVTVAEVLKGQGYATALVGKWGLGEPDTTGLPTRQGFDFFFGYLNQHHAHNYYPTYLWRNEERVELDNVVPNEDRQGGGVASVRNQYSHDQMTEEALRFVERSQDGPFFLYLAYTLPHANNEAGGRGMEVPTDEPYSDRPWPQPQKNHAAMITRLDRDVGRLVALLKKLGLDEDTVIFFASDNGPHREGGADPAFFDSNGPLRGIKRDLYEGGIRVPGIVRWPGRVAAGTTSDHPWAFWDVLPTAAELGGAPSPGGLDGVSIAPLLLGGAAPRGGTLYWEFRDKTAVRDGKWKAVRNGKERPVELYDLGADLGETKDLAAAHPDVAKRLEAMMRESHGPPRVASPDTRGEEA